MFIVKKIILTGYHWTARYRLRAKRLEIKTTGIEPHAHKGDAVGHVYTNTPTRNPGFAYRVAIST